MNKMHELSGLLAKLKTEEAIDEALTMWLEEKAKEYATTGTFTNPEVHKDLRKLFLLNDKNYTCKKCKWEFYGCDYCPHCGSRSGLSPAESKECEPEESSEVEKLSEKFHAIYQKEAKRQAGEGLDQVRHPDNYADLPERTKEYDRVLARFVLENFQPRPAQEPVIGKSGQYLSGDFKSFVDDPAQEKKEELPCRRCGKKSLLGTMSCDCEDKPRGKECERHGGEYGKLDCDCNEGEHIIDSTHNAVESAIDKSRDKSKTWSELTKPEAKKEIDVEHLANELYKNYQSNKTCLETVRWKEIARTAIDRINGTS